MQFYITVFKLRDPVDQKVLRDPAGSQSLVVPNEQYHFGDRLRPSLVTTH